MERSSLEARSHAEDRAEAQAILREIEKADSRIDPAGETPGTAIRLPSGELVIKIRENWWQSARDGGYVFDKGVAKLLSLQNVLPLSPAKTSQEGEVRIAKNGERFTKISEKHWQSDRDGGYLLNGAIDKLNAQVVPCRVDADSVRMAGGEVFIRVHENWWQSETDGSCVSDEGLAKLQ